MKTLLTLLFLCLHSFATAQKADSAHPHHAIVAAADISFPFYVFCKSNTYSWQLGYRHYLNEQFALRATYNWYGSSTDSEVEKSTRQTNTPRIGLQFATSKKPMHLLLTADIGVSDYKYSGTTNPLGSSSQSYDYRKKTQMGTGLFYGLGLGIECLIHDNFSVVFLLDLGNSNMEVTEIIGNNPPTVVNRNVDNIYKGLIWQLGYRF